MKVYKQLCDSSFFLLKQWKQLETASWDLSSYQNKKFVKAAEVFDDEFQILMILRSRSWVYK